MVSLKSQKNRLTPGEIQLTEKASTFDEMNAQDVLKSLNSDLGTGLNAADVESRLKRYGYNEILEKKTNPLLRLVQKSWGLTAWMLEAIIILSLYMHNYPDVYIVSGLLVFNAMLGFVEEQRASNAVEALKKNFR